MLFAGLGSVRLVKNYDLGLESEMFFVVIFKTSVTVLHYADLP